MHFFLLSAMTKIQSKWRKTMNLSSDILAIISYDWNFRSNTGLYPLSIYREYVISILCYVVNAIHTETKKQIYFMIQLHTFCMLLPVSYINMSLCFMSGWERVACMVLDFIHHPIRKIHVHSICCSIEISL